MKIFHCGNCESLVFFENTKCLACDHKLAYLPDEQRMGALRPAGDDLWKPVFEGDEGPAYRLCRNYTKENVCNWAVPADDANPFCQSCRLTSMIPDLSVPEYKAEWARLEAAKRRLIYSLLSLHLPLASKIESPETGLTFQFLADPPGGPVVLTGHNDGVITVNIAEADDSVREKRRNQMHEGYRTLLGHFRHEIGHYYWDRLVADSEWLVPYRELFGDESEDYDEALRRHYREGAPADWQTRFVSAYASTHSWEDWAETWAHYLHMTDTLETAVACGLSLRPKRRDEPALKASVVAEAVRRADSFDLLIEAWFPLTYVFNNLNRGMGLQDGYPFVLSGPAIKKLRFVHNVIAGVREKVPAAV